MKAYWGVDV